MKKKWNQKGFAQAQARVKGSPLVTQDAVLSEIENIARALQLGPSITRQCPYCKHWFKQDPNCVRLSGCCLSYNCSLKKNGYVVIYYLGVKEEKTQISNHLTLKISIRTSH